jgi:hypothetical protein
LKRKRIRSVAGREKERTQDKREKKIKSRLNRTIMKIRVKI